MENGFNQTLTECRFEVVKNRLLLRWLDETPGSEAHPRIIAEANVATVLAWLTPFPLLLFPCLFDERARAGLDDARRQARRYWRGLDTIPAASGQILTQLNNPIPYLFPADARPSRTARQPALVT